ncbi:hemerythrin domain-containing protein [Neobacillus dielmonensis]|uniref:hemerythrin domain-containing protein n=1 Tax=Neobacillus dielmonensis TaxID=1347369 RepID=UPI0005AB504D|nr:hemerythrin domain-containing protein [Neobacillus dielmonensis]
MQGCHSGLIGNGPITLSEGLNQLVSEHTSLRSCLEALFSLCNQVEQEPAGTDFEKLFTEVREFFTNLEFHSEREEDFLFRMMEVYLGKNGGPISVMEYEHEQARSFINEFLKNAESQTVLTTDEKIQNSNLIKNAYYTLLDHFMKEEQVLYPMAERMLTDEEKEILLQKVSETR